MVGYPLASSSTARNGPRSPKKSSGSPSGGRPNWMTSTGPIRRCNGTGRCRKNHCGRKCGAGCGIRSEHVSREVATGLLTTEAGISTGNQMRPQRHPSGVAFVFRVVLCPSSLWGLAILAGGWHIEVGQWDIEGIKHRCVWVRRMSDCSEESHSSRRSALRRLAVCALRGCGGGSGVSLMLASRVTPCYRSAWLSSNLIRAS